MQGKQASEGHAPVALQPEHSGLQVYPERGMLSHSSLYLPAMSSHPQSRTVFSSLVRHITLGGLLALNPMLVLAAEEGVETLCDDHETTYFSCAGKGRLASVCASANFSGKKGYIQLRIAEGDQLEVEVPASRRNPGRVVKGRLLSVTGSGIYMRFDASRSSYVVYSLTGKNGQVRGIGRLKNGQIKTHTTCEGDSYARLENASVPSGDIVAVSKN